MGGIGRFSLFSGYVCHEIYINEEETCFFLLVLLLQTVESSIFKASDVQCTRRFKPCS